MIQLVLAIVVTVVLAFLTFKWLDYKTHHGERIPVPDLSKMRLDKVEESLADLQLQFVVTDSGNYNPDYPKYSVIEQNPKPGDFVKEGRTIYLKLNPSGFPKIAMPDFIRDTKREVVPALRALGFEIGSITYENDIARNAVLELRANGEKIEPGEKVLKKTTINLVLGNGDPYGEHVSDSLQLQAKQPINTLP